MWLTLHLDAMMQILLQLESTEFISYFDYINFISQLKIIFYKTALYPVQNSSLVLSRPPHSIPQNNEYRPRQYPLFNLNIYYTGYNH